MAVGPQPVPQKPGLPTISVSVTIGPFGAADVDELQDALLEHADEWNVLVQRPQALWPSLPELREALHAVAIHLPEALAAKAVDHFLSELREWIKSRRQSPELAPRYVTVWGPRGEKLLHVQVDDPAPQPVVPRG